MHSCIFLIIIIQGGNRCKDNAGACLFGKCRDVGNDFRCTQCETGYVLREDNKRCVGKSKKSKIYFFTTLGQKKNIRKK